jgi:curved DNA-binding protein CbpA
MISFYDVLGVAAHATADDLRRAFRRKAKRLHPDTGNGTDAAMSRLNEAYETLKDPERRAIYDQSQLPRAYRLPDRATAQSPRGLDPFAYQVQVFQPLDHSLAGALRSLLAAIVALADDLYDDAYLARFGRQVEKGEANLTLAYQRLMGTAWPSPLIPALNHYRQGICQAEDAIENFHTFIQTLDSDTLVEGRSLLRCAEEILDEARTALGAL